MNNSRRLRDVLLGLVQYWLLEFDNITPADTWPVKAI